MSNRLGSVRFVVAVVLGSQFSLNLVAGCLRLPIRQFGLQFQNITCPKFRNFWRRRIAANAMIICGGALSASTLFQGQLGA